VVAKAPTHNSTHKSYRKVAFIPTAERNSTSAAPSFVAVFLRVEDPVLSEFSRDAGCPGRFSVRFSLCSPAKCSGCDVGCEARTSDRLQFALRIAWQPVAGGQQRSCKGRSSRAESSAATREDVQREPDAVGRSRLMHPCLSLHSILWPCALKFASVLRPAECRSISAPKSLASGASPHAD
jgi:hypothetical protein